MSYSSPAPVPGPAPRRSMAPYLAAGCVLIGLCVLCALVGGGYFFFTQRTVASAAAPSVEYILDASPRMAQPAQGENGSRLSVARGVLAEVVRPSDPAVTAGLRVFGSGAQPIACSDTNLLVPLAPANQAQISTHLLALTAGSNSDAAMAQAMIAAIRDLSRLKGKQTLVVVTGGADSCTPQAGQLIAAEAQKAGIALQLFVIGYQVPAGDGVGVQGLVDGAGGTFVKADTKLQLKMVIDSIQQYVESQKGVTVSSVVATAAAVVGTANVVSASTPTPPSASSPTPPGASTPTPPGASSPTPPGASETPGAVSTGAAAAATASATQGGAVAVGTGQTACDHPYFPLRPGATWTFTGDQGATVWTVTDVTGDQTQATATMTFKTGDTTGVYHWQCTPDGIISYEFGNIATSSSTGIDFKITQHAGVWLPPASKLQTGYSWENSYTMEATGNSQITFIDTVNQMLSVSGAEKQDVAGTSYDALKITGPMTIKVQAAALANTTFTGTQTFWLVQGIGPVRFESQFENAANSSSVLTSYHIP